jgi:hypothetical protein
LLAATLYQGNPDRNHKLCNTVSTERYILHMQMLLDASYLDLQLEIDSEGRLRTKLYDKRDYFNFSIVNFPLICSNIPSAPAYYISQLKRYCRACGSYQDFLDIGLLLTRRLLNQWFLLVSRPISICGVLYFKLIGIDAINEITKFRII